MRLELLSDLSKMLAKSNFNSIKVRLEPVKGFLVRGEHIDFNSIKVRLELKIKLNFFRFLLFQFHKGAIRTPILQLNYPKGYHFNSIKVRLELLLCMELLILLQNFNSIKVRLEQ